TSAYIIEEELKEQLRKKQEALKRFQRQVKSRVNQQVRLRKKQQLQRSYEAVSSKAEKEGSIAMHSSDLAHLTPKRTSVFPSNLNAAIGSARLPPPQMLEGGIEDRENQYELFQQQAQALSQSMKEARHRLASFKTVNQKDAPEFPDDIKKRFPTQEKALCRKPSFTRINIGIRGELPLEIHQGLLTPADYQKFMDDQEPEESSSVMIDKKGKKHLSWGDQEDLFSEDKDIPFSRVQKVQFKTPLFDVMEEEEVKQLHQDVLPEAQDYLPEAQGDLTSVLDAEWEAQRCEPRLSTLHIDLEGHTVEPKAQAVKTKAKSVRLKDQTIGLEDGDIALEVQDFPLRNQTFLPTDQHILPKDQNVLPKCQDQDFLPKDQDFLPKDQGVLPRDQCVLPKDQNIQHKCQDQDFLPSNQHRNYGQASHNVTDEKWRKELFLERCEFVIRDIQEPVSAREQVELSVVKTYAPYSNHLLKQLKDGRKICFWMAISILHPSSRERLPAED
ncbi:hypothetical protein Celaphus_00013513, partial [Cervus elaphus hippelaphus]